MNFPSLQGVVSAEEWQTRVDLAACYRLVAMHGWSDLVFTHISARVPGPEHHFLINPYGLMFDEITASSLVKVDQLCNKVIDSPFPVNPAGFVIHSAVHEAREDVQCVLHTHTRAGVAVSAQKCGVLPISQQSTFVLSSLAYHDYEGVAFRDEEKPRLQADLGDATFMVLRNHGLLVATRSIADCFLAMYTFESACQIQLAAQAGGELVQVDPRIVKGVAEASRVQTGGMGGAFVWPSLIRKLDKLDPGVRGMNAQAWIPQVLVVSLALVMLGLGLSLSLADFRRVLGHPKAVAIALGLQVILLPAACYALIVLLSVPPLYAVGLMLLAASPGGVSANLFSHLFGGNVAMNISLTAINTVVSIVTLPLIGTWAIATFANSGQVVPLQLGKVLEVIGVIMIPVAIGMAIRSRAPAFAERCEKPMKLFSALVLAAFALIAIVKEWDALRASFMQIGPAVVAFNLVSLLSGYYVSCMAGLDKPMSTAISYEIGIHNSTLAMFIALSVLNNFQLALPAALYSVSMYITATLFGMLVLRRPNKAPHPARPLT